MQIKYVGSQRPLNAGDPAVYAAPNGYPPLGFPYNVAVVVPSAFGDLLADSEFQPADDEANTYVPPPKPQYGIGRYDRSTKQLVDESGALLPVVTKSQLATVTRDSKGVVTGAMTAEGTVSNIVRVNGVVASYALDGINYSVTRDSAGRATGVVAA